jgi:hypothetical protein
MHRAIRLQPRFSTLRFRLELNELFERESACLFTEVSAIIVALIRSPNQAAVTIRYMVDSLLSSVSFSDRCNLCFEYAKNPRMASNDGECRCRSKLP